MTEDPRDGLWRTYKAFMSTLRDAMAAMAKDEEIEPLGLIARAKAATAKAGVEGFLRGMDMKIAKSLREMTPDDARALCSRILAGFEGIIGHLRPYTTTPGPDDARGNHAIGKDDIGRADSRALPARSVGGGS